MSKTVYLCENPACTLGSAHDPGRFAGGITAQQKHMLTGDPVEAIDKKGEHGDGYCPNCGQKSERKAPTPAEEHQAHIDAEIKRLQALKKEKVS